jgi:hypothetical protein
MSPSTPAQTALFVLGLGMFTLVAVRFGDWWLRRKLDRWAASLGVRLIEYRGEPFWRGPRAWRRTEQQHDVRVVVETRDGVRREGWVLFTGPWHGFGPDRVDEEWDA